MVLWHDLYAAEPVARNLDARRTVWRYTDCEREPVAVQCPRALDTAVDRVVGRGCTGQVADDVRLDQDMPEARRRRVRVDSCQRFDHPGADVAEHDVVARVRAAPALPQRRRALVDPPAPARLRPLRRDPVRQVGPAGVGQRVENVLGAEDSRVDVPVVRLYRPAESVRYGALTLAGHQALVERAAQRGLAAVRVAVVPPIVESCVELPGNLLSKRPVPGLVLLLTEQSGRLRDNKRIAVVVAG